jgi:hypothetical protein
MEQQSELLSMEWLSDSIDSYIHRKRLRRHVIYITVLTIVSAIIISLPFVYVDITVQSGGVIRPNGEISVITAPMTETVERVCAKEGDRLQKEDEILRFRTNSPDGKIEYQHNRSKEVNAQIADLEWLSKVSTHEPLHRLPDSKNTQNTCRSNAVYKPTCANMKRNGDAIKCFLTRG